MPESAESHFGLTPRRAGDSEGLPYSRSMCFFFGSGGEAFRIPPLDYTRFAAEAVAGYRALLLKELGKNSLEDVFTTCVDDFVSQDQGSREEAYSLFKIKRANSVEAYAELYFRERIVPPSQKVGLWAQKGKSKEEWILEKTVSHVLKLGSEKIDFQKELETTFFEYWEMISSALDLFLPDRVPERIPDVSNSLAEATGIIKNFNGLLQTYRAHTLPFIDPFQIKLYADCTASEEGAWPPNFLPRVEIDFGNSSFMSSGFVDEIASFCKEIIRKEYGPVGIQDVLYKGLPL